MSTEEFGPLIGSIDEGTSSARFGVFASKTGELVANHQIEITNIYPQAGWVEQDPIKILDSVIECIEETLKKLSEKNISACDIIAVGITNQRETTILWDKQTGLPLYNAIIWMDNRTESTINSLLESKKNNDVNQFQELTGLPISPYFSASKYKWLIDNVPSVKTAIEEERCLFGTVDTWLIWNLTGGVENGIHMTDVTNACRTLLMNLRTLQWDETLTSFFEIPPETLPEIRSSSEIYGSIQITSLKNIPLSGCVGDQHAALIGNLCFNPGDTKCTYGTGCFIISNTGSERIISKHGLLTTLAYKLGKNAEPVYALEGAIASAGSTITWLKNNLGIIDDAVHSEKLASDVSNSSGVIFVPAFQGLYAPYWEPRARGLIYGLTMETDKRHIARAAIEGVAYQTAAILESITKDSEIDLKDLKVDGGMSKNKFLLQFQADICGVIIKKQETEESTIFGAAIAAGLAEGIQVWDLKTLKMNQNTFHPKLSDKERMKLIKKWENAVKKSVP